ncbi:hypothetical protein [Spirosoma aerophilum]
MENPAKSTTENEVEALRQAIKNKYKQYHLLDRDRFPEFEYNTNRTNYEPLRESFNEEFYAVRGLDRANNTIHIPSTNTLALLFTGDGYLPKGKILNTCRSYAEGRTQKVITPAVSDPVAPTPITQLKVTLSSRINRRTLLLVSLGIAAGLLTYASIFYSRSALPAGKVIITSPTSGMTVPRIMIAQGKAPGAKQVWLVVHNPKYPEYYVQDPIGVAKDGVWEGLLYTGSVAKGNIGMRFQVRAFANLTQSLPEDQIIDAWPKAEFSSDIIEVVRGAQDVLTPAP